MNIYLTHTGDGDCGQGAYLGIGATLQYILFTYAYSRAYNFKFKFDGFTNVDQYQFHPEYNTFTWSEKFNTFFNLPNDPVTGPTKNINLNNVSEAKNYVGYDDPDANTNIILTVPKYDFGLLQNKPEPYKQYFWELADRIKHEEFLSSDFYNISLHIRCFNKIDVDNNPIREYFNETKNTYYSNLLSQILKQPTNKKKKLYIHTQTDEQNLIFLKDINCDYKVLNNAYPWTSLSYMIQSNLLIGANSSFSYIAHLLNKNESFFRDNFQLSQSLYANTKFIDSLGNLKI